MTISANEFMIGLGDDVVDYLSFYAFGIVDPYAIDVRIQWQEKLRLECYNEYFDILHDFTVK